MEGSSGRQSPLPPTSPSKLSVIGSAFASIKSYFTPERVRGPHDVGAPSIGITPLTKEFAGMSLNDASYNSTDSFRTSKSVVDDDSFLSSTSFADASDHDASGQFLHIDPETPYDPEATVLNEFTIIESCNATGYSPDDSVQLGLGSQSVHDEKVLEVEKSSAALENVQNISLGLGATTAKNDLESSNAHHSPEKSAPDTSKNSTTPEPEKPKNSVLNITPLLEVTMNQEPVSSSPNKVGKSVQVLGDKIPKGETCALNESSVVPAASLVSDITTSEDQETAIKPTEEFGTTIEDPVVGTEVKAPVSEVLQPEVPRTKDLITLLSSPEEKKVPEVVCLSPDETILLSSSPEPIPFRPFGNVLEKEAADDSVICLDLDDDEEREFLLNDVKNESERCESFKEFLEDSEIVLKLPQNVTVSGNLQISSSEAPAVPENELPSTATLCSETSLSSTAGQESAKKPAQGITEQLEPKIPETEGESEKLSENCVCETNEVVLDEAQNIHDPPTFGEDLQNSLLVNFSPDKTGVEDLQTSSESAERNDTSDRTEEISSAFKTAESVQITPEGQKIVLTEAVLAAHNRSESSECEMRNVLETSLEVQCSPGENEVQNEFLSSVQLQPSGKMDSPEPMEISYVPSLPDKTPIPAFVPVAHSITFVEEPMEISICYGNVDPVLEESVPKAAEVVAELKSSEEIADRSDEETLSANSSTSFDSQLTAGTLEDGQASKGSSEEAVPASNKELGEKSQEASCKVSSTETNESLGGHPEVSMPVSSELHVTAVDTDTSVPVEPEEIQTEKCDEANEPESQYDAVSKSEIFETSVSSSHSDETRKVSELTEKHYSEVSEPSAVIPPTICEPVPEVSIQVLPEKLTPPKISKTTLPIPTVSIIPATPEREKSKDEIVFVPRDLPEVPLADTTVDFCGDRTTIVFSPTAAESTRIQDQTTLAGAEDSFGEPTQDFTIGEDACITDAAAFFKGIQNMDSTMEVSICANITGTVADAFQQHVNYTLDGIESLDRTIERIESQSPQEMRDVVDEIICKAGNVATEQSVQNVPKEIDLPALFEKVEEVDELSKTTVDAIVAEAKQKVLSLLEGENSVPKSVEPNQTTKVSAVKINQKCEMPEEVEYLSKTTIDVIVAEATEKVQELLEGGKVPKVITPDQTEGVEEEAAVVITPENVEDIEELAHATVNEVLAVAVERVQSFLEDEKVPEGAKPAEQTEEVEVEAAVVITPENVEEIEELAKTTVNEVLAVAVEKVQSFLEGEKVPEENEHAELESAMEVIQMSEEVEDVKDLAKAAIDEIVTEASEKVQSFLESEKEIEPLIPDMHGLSLLEKSAGSPVSSEKPALKTPEQSRGLLVDASPLVLQPMKQQKQMKDLMSETLDLSRSIMTDPVQSLSSLKLIDASPYVLPPIEKPVRDFLNVSFEEQTSDPKSTDPVNLIDASVIMTDLEPSDSVNLIDHSILVTDSKPSDEPNLIDTSIRMNDPKSTDPASLFVTDPEQQGDLLPDPVPAFSGRLLNFESSLENDEEVSLQELEESAIMEGEEEDEKCMLSTIAEVTEISIAISPQPIPRDSVINAEKIMSTTPLGMTLKENNPTWDSPVDAPVKHNVESTPLHPAVTRVLNESNVSVSPISGGHESQGESLLNAAMLQSLDCVGNFSNDDKNVSGMKSSMSFNVSPLVVEERTVEEGGTEENVFKMPKASKSAKQDNTIFVGSIVEDKIKSKDDAKIVVVAPYRPLSDNECDENLVLPNRAVARKSSSGILREINENVILEEKMGGILSAIKDTDGKKEVKVAQTVADDRESMLLREIERLKETNRQKEEDYQRKELEFQQKMEQLERSKQETAQKITKSIKRTQQNEKILATKQKTYQQSQLVCQALKTSAEDAQKMLTKLSPVPSEELEAAQASFKTAQQHVASAELAFIDVHAKFETLKSKIPVIKKSIADAESEVLDLRRQKAVSDEKIRASESQTSAELEELGMAVAEDKERFLAESKRIGGQLRKAELVAKTTQDGLDKITLDNERLSNLCDDIIAGKT